MMKNKIKYVLSGVLLLLLLVGGCTDDFTEVNIDPNNPVDVPAINLMAHAMRNIAERQEAGWLNHTYLGGWSQLFTKIQYIDEDRYIFRMGNINGFFNGPYQGELIALKVAIEKAQAQGFPTVEAVSRILRAWAFQQLTDNFGDIPYSEALKAQADILQPKYDSQQSIYMDLINELKEAEALLAAADGPGPLANGDLYYGGDIMAWRKFANSLLLRAYMRISGADAATAQAGIAAIVGGKPIFESNADNARMVIPGERPYRNGLFTTLELRTDQGSSKTMIDILLERNDPRLGIYAQPIEDDFGKNTFGATKDYVGSINGADVQPVQTEVSLLGIPIAYDAARPYLLMDYADVCFILAEAAQKGWAAGGTAQEWYEAGITASLQDWTALAKASPLNGVYPEDAEITAADIEAYLQEPLVAWNAADALELIYTQRWLALMPIGPEAFALVRRTGYPRVIESYELPMTAYPGEGVPLRFPYPETELVRNADNVAAASAGMRKDMYGKPVWWDVRTTKADGTARLGL